MPNTFDRDWPSLGVVQDRRLFELTVSGTPLAGQLVGLGADGSTVFVGGTLRAGRPWPLGEAVSLTTVQRRTADPTRAEVTGTGMVALVLDLGDGRARVYVMVDPASADDLRRQNWPVPAKRRRE